MSALFIGTSQVLVFLSTSAFTVLMISSFYPSVRPLSWDQTCVSNYSSNHSAWMSSKHCPCVSKTELLYFQNLVLQKSIFPTQPSVQFSSVAQSCPTLCDPMNRSTPGLPVHHHLPKFTQTHVHRVRDAIQPSHPRSSPSSPAPNPSQHQSLFQ